MEQQQHTIAEKVIHEIQERNVTPIAKWRFVFKNTGFWSLWGLCVVIGACAIAAMIFTFIHSGWRYRSLTHDSFLNFFFDVLPLFWLVSLLVMVALGYSLVRNTTRGYRFSFFAIVLASIISSFIGGTLLYTLGVAEPIDKIREPLPFGVPILSLEETRWNNQDRGLVSGTVRGFDSKTQMVDLVLFTGSVQAISTRELFLEDTRELIEGNHVRIIGGTDPSGRVFVACVVLPWDDMSGAMMPRPLAVPPPQLSERNAGDIRNSVCKDVRPYQRYKQTITN